MFLYILFWIVYNPDKYKTQRMCDEAVDDSIAALKLDLLQVKWLKKLNTAFYTDDGLLLVDGDSGIVNFCWNEMGILSVNLNNINFDNNFDEDDPDTIILIRLLA